MVVNEKIAGIRKEYKLHELHEAAVEKNPLSQFTAWWFEVLASEIEEPNAMTLATSSPAGFPDARIVLLKGYDENGFVFFTNYESAKGRELEINPHACLVFFWKELERQVRIEGKVEKVSAEESDHYFNSRPEGSRLGAWISPQSSVIPGREWLQLREQEIVQQFHGKEIARPQHWGGYRVIPHTIEFWQGRPNRLHDRIKYSLGESGAWRIERLAP
jgi:pyridoxamine 5'-phosphate oxidase